MNKIFISMSVFIILTALIVPSFAQTSTDKLMQNEIMKGVDFDSPDYNYDMLTEAQKKVIDEDYEKWVKDHTFNVTVTQSYNSKQTKNHKTELTVTETYVSDDPNFIKMFGSDTFVKEQSFLCDENESQISYEGKIISLKEGDQTTITTTSPVVMAVGTDIYEWWRNSNYPTHLWKPLYLNIYEQKDPVNLIWNNTTASAARSRIISASGWTATVVEDSYYIMDRNMQWVSSYSVANNTYRDDGGYHVRIYQLSNGIVVGSAHQDSSAFGLSPPHWHHQVVAFESVESMVAGYFGISGWSVSPNSSNLGNSCSSPAYNNGWATKITKT